MMGTQRVGLVIHSGGIIFLLRCVLVHIGMIIYLLVCKVSAKHKKEENIL